MNEKSKKSMFLQATLEPLSFLQAAFAGVSLVKQYTYSIIKYKGDSAYHKFCTTFCKSEKKL